MNRLIVHPDTPPNSVRDVTVKAAMAGPRELWLEYSVSPTAGLLLPLNMAPIRQDDLWKSTCFELFVQPAGSEAYLEFNFSPSSQWAAYRFDGYRSGRQDLPSHDPDIWISSPDDYFFLAVEALPELPAGRLKVGLSAVIEEMDGTKSYWALAHPLGDPDFHHPACFALELPPADAS